MDARIGEQGAPEMSPDRVALLVSLMDVGLQNLRINVSPESWENFAIKYANCLNNHKVSQLARSKMNKKRENN